MGGVHQQNDLVKVLGDKLDDATVNFVNGGTYLSRNDWEGTWPVASNASAEIPANILFSSHWCRAVMLAHYHTENVRNDDSPSYFSFGRRRVPLGVRRLPLSFFE